jgi:succinate-semialdehyde dehydrogenase / glutarate-semialdehyde dehydrogenase
MAIDQLTEDTLRVFNPATGSAVGELERSSRAQVGQSLVAARRAQSHWKRVPRHRRYDIMVRFSQLVTEQAEDLAHLLCAESGKTLQQTRAEISVCARLFRGFAERMLALKEDAHFLDSQAGLERDLMITRREPLGIVVAIIPFNFPAELFGHKVAPAIAMGNAVVVKPPEDDPLTVARLAALLTEAGLPEGVVEIAAGGGEVGAWLVESDIPAAVSLTGSTQTGLRVAASAAKTLKRVSLELGSNDPLIVLEDADLELAVDQAVQGRQEANGQCCCSNKRLIVHRSVAKEFTDLLTSRFGALELGDPAEDRTQLGPLIHEKAASRVGEQVRATVDAGARITTGGSRPERAFYEPTVLVGVTPEMEIARDMEVFGPVLPILEFGDDGEAVSIANASSYGLSGAVFSTDFRRAFSLGAELDTGQVVINRTGLFRPDLAGFGGHKLSGNGREGLETSLEEFAQHKNFSLRGALDWAEGIRPQDEREVRHDAAS